MAANEDDDDRSVSERLWEDFSVEMDSSVFGAMERLAEEAKRMNETDEVESDFVNEVVIEPVIEENPCGNEVIIAPVGEDIINLNEVEISDDANKATSLNEVVIPQVTNEAASLNEVTTRVDKVVKTEVNDASISSALKEYQACLRWRKIKFATNKQSSVKMSHFLSYEQFFFVEDLIEAVQDIRNGDMENSPEPKSRWKCQPCPLMFFFTLKIKCFVQKCIRDQKKDFISLIKESASTSDICVFETCKERFIEKYKPIAFSREAFLNFCAAIAYLGIHCWATGLDLSAKRKATNYICSLFYEAYKRGHVNRTCLRKSKMHF